MVDLPVHYKTRLHLNAILSCRRFGRQLSPITGHWGRERIAAAPRKKSPAPDVPPGLAGRFKSVRRRVGEPTPGHKRGSCIGPAGFGTCRRGCPGCSTSGRSNFRPRMAGRIEGVGCCVGDPTAGCNRRGGVGPGHVHTRLQDGTRCSIRECPGAGPSGHVPPAVGTSQPRHSGSHRCPPAAPVR